MRIIHLASGDLWAGAEVQLFHLAKRLYQNDNVELLVVLLNHGQLEDQLRAQGINVEVIDESIFSGFIIFKKLSVTVGEYNPDIIHTHRLKENVMGGLVALLKRKISVRTVHGANEFSSAPFSFRRLVFEGLDKLSGYFLQKKIIAVSAEMYKSLSKSYPESKLEIIENSVDLDYIEFRSMEPCHVDMDDKCFHIVFIGRFVSVKRTDIFYDIAKSMSSRDHSKIFQFHMIGDGPLSLEIEKRIEVDKLNDVIHLHGFVSNTAPLLKKMDLLIITSDHEGLPMTLLEAMTLNVPVLTRSIPSVRAVLCDGACGYVLASDEIEAFVSNIEYISNSKRDVKKKSDRAKKNVIETYNVNQNTEKYLNLYNSILAVS